MTDKMKSIINTTLKAIIFGALVAAPSLSNAQSIRINVADATFTRPLIEKLVSEYQKQNPDFKAEIVSNASESSDAIVSITDDNITSTATIARYFLLPVANASNSILNEKKVQKGLNGKLTREIFVQKTLDELIDDQDKKDLPGTVYTLSGKHATTTSLLANSLNVDVKDLKGKKVIGREENVITVVKKRPEAIAVDVASLVYDNSTRKPVNGLAVLPIDIDGNGKISDEERSALTSIDALTEYINTQNKTSLPTGTVRIDSHNKDIDAFLVWTSNEGQNFLGSEGYLKNNTQYVAQK